MAGLSCVLSPASCVVGSVGGSVFNQVFDASAHWVAGSAGWVFDELGTMLSKTSSPGVVIAVATPTFNNLLSVAPLIALIALLVTILGALRRGDAASMVREAALALVIIVVALCGAPSIATLTLRVTDALCNVAAPNAADIVHQVANRAASIPLGVPGFAALVLDLVAIAGAFALWFELVVRSAVLSLLLALAPVVVAAALWRPARRLAARLAETFLAVALAKFVVVVALAMGATAATSSSAVVVVTGIAVVLLAVFAPFALLRVVPLLELSALHAVSGMRQGATAAVRRTAATVGAAAAGVFPAAEPGPPARREDLGIEEWPSSPEPELPEQPDTRPPPPIGVPSLRRGHAVAQRDAMGPVIGWHFDE